MKIFYQENPILTVPEPPISNPKLPDKFMPMNPD